MDAITAQFERFYAPVDQRGHFRLADLERKKKLVRISPSDEKYGGVTAKAVVMHELGTDAPEGDAQGELWQEQKIAWLWKNFDGSYWWDTLSMSKQEARNWASNPERTESIGSRLVAVQFEVV